VACDKLASAEDYSSIVIALKDLEVPINEQPCKWMGKGKEKKGWVG
jgi:hypothetical protein